MRLSLIGAVLLVLLGVVLVVLGITWYREYNTEYALTVGDVLAGEPRGCLGLGPRHKRAVVTGLALRSKAEPVTVQTHSSRGETVSDRVFFPLRVPEGNQAILVSLPHEAFDDHVLLYDTADQRMTFRGVIEHTPPAGETRVENLFDGVTFPTRYCLTVGERGGWKEPGWLAVSGAGLVLMGVVLAVVKRPRRRREKVHPGRGRHSSSSASGGSPVAGSASADVMAAISAGMQGTTPFPPAAERVSGPGGPAVSTGESNNSEVSSDREHAEPTDGERM